METMKGVIGEMTADGKRCKIGSEWYSVFASPSMGGAKVGDEVKFAYVEKESGGKIYNNIKGSVSVLSKGDGEAPSGGKSSARSGGVDTNMNIIRQNALTNSVAFYNARQASYNAQGIHPADTEDALASIIAVAETFAQFSSGEYAEKKKQLEAEAEQQLARISRAVVY